MRALRFLVLATGLLLLGPGVSGATAGDPTYGAPEVGECHRITYADMQSSSETSAPVACGNKHTARIVAVPQLPDGVAWGDRDTAAFQAMVIEACQPGFQDTVGGTHTQRHLAAYSLAWYIPTKAQRSEGARWFRCDVISYRQLQLGTLPATTPYVESPMPDKRARCLAETGSIIRLTNCAADHDYRAKKLYRLTQDKFPGDKKVNTIASRKCDALISTKRYAWIAVNSLGWRTGERHITCYAQDS